MSLRRQGSSPQTLTTLNKGTDKKTPIANTPSKSSKKTSEVNMNGVDSSQKQTLNSAKRLRSKSNEENIDLGLKQASKKQRLTNTSFTLNEGSRNQSDCINVNGLSTPGVSTEGGIARLNDSGVSTEEKNDEMAVSSISDAISAKKVKKLKGPTKEEIRARKKMQISYLNNFVNISLKYSVFLEKKIDHTRSSGNSGVVRPSKKVREDITKKLNFFVGELRPYQIEGVIWLTTLFENSVNGVLADEMGLGKTIQIIALFCHLYERRVAGPFLIVAPLSTLNNWEQEFKRFAPKIPVFRLQGSFQERQEQKRRITMSCMLNGVVVKPVVLCSYQVPLSEESFLQRFNWQYVVVDEGHRIKNPESCLSKELRALKSVNRTLLTGTPLQNDIKELWALFNFLMPELFQDIEGFSTLLELEDIKDTDKLLENEARTQVIATIHKVLAPFMLRREKKFVLTDLVPKKEVIIYCSLTETQNYLYRATLKEDSKRLLMKELESQDDKPLSRGNRSCRQMKVDYKMSFEIPDNAQEYAFRTIARKNTLLNEVNKWGTNSRLLSSKHVPIKCLDCPYMCYVTMSNTMMMLRKIVNHPYLVWCPLNPEKITTCKEMLVNEELIKHSGKLMVLDALLPKLKAGGHKVLLFSTFVMFMDIIEEMLIMRGYGYRRFDGSTKYEDRNERIDDFMTDPKVFVFLLSTRAGGLGLNLTAADTVIFMDRDWNPMADMQAQDRCHRIGQTRPVMIYSLITKGTIDEVVLTRGDMKKRLEKIVLQEGKFNQLKQSLSGNELQELEDFLNNEEVLLKVRANGLMYTDKELNQILDRSELFKEIENKK